MGTVEESDFCVAHLLNASDKRATSPHAVATLAQSVLNFVSLLTVTLNLLVIISISHYKQLHTPTNLLLLSLAISDFSVGIGMIFISQFVHQCWPFGDAGCIVFHFLCYVVTCASVWTIVLISLDRYIAICQPLLYYVRVTVRRVKLCVCLCWFCTALYSALVLQNDVENPGNICCSGECDYVGTYYLGILDVCLFFILPVGVIVVLYTRVFAVVINKVRSKRSQITAAKSKRAVLVNRSELKAARALGVVIVVFLLCLCPYYIALVSGKDSTSDSSSVTAELYLLYLNSCLNPIMYTFLYSWFRTCLRNIVTLQILKPGSSNAQILSTSK